MQRAIKIIRETISDLEVDIKGQIVLTEVGSNNYLFTPIIAAMCGAKKVFAIAKDSRYGLAADIVESCKSMLDELQIDNIEFCINEVPTHALETADIICNSGNLRPLDQNKLKYAKPTAVIPLMYEAWEYREDDVDANYCKANNIKVAGTWENFPKIKVFDYCGMLGVKMALNAGYEITGNSIIVWSDDHFGEVIAEKFRAEGASVIHTINTNDLYDHLSNIDFVFIADYDESRNYFGNDGIFDIEKIKSLNTNVCFVHLYGNIDIDITKSYGLDIYPQITGKAKMMTYTLGHVGLIPILRLQVAGMKVAQEMLLNNYSSISQVL